MQKPSWCLVVKTMYRMPACRAWRTQASGSKRTGLNREARATYSLSLMGLECGNQSGFMIGQEASTPATEYAPQ